MKAKETHCSKYLLLVLVVFSSHACRENAKESLKIIGYPDLKLGFTTQNFQKSMPLGVENLTELMTYASGAGYQFIEIRDDQASLTVEDCRILAGIAEKNNLEVIYEFQRNLLDPGYFEIFNKAMENALQFSDPVIFRAMISKSEFTDDPDKKGWTRDELARIATIADSCSKMAESRNAHFLIENSDESFFGDGQTYYGLSDFFDNTSKVGLQFDMANPFRKSARVKSDPSEVLKYLGSLGSRWVSTHIKTIVESGGEMQPVLTGSPLTVEEAIAQMGKQGVKYVSLELLAVADKQECFKNHNESIHYLREKGIVGK
jgi:sugar phosphate isomerase/epimerase